MPAALAAAHIGHQIEHSSALMGFLVGAAVGLAVGVAVVATVASGGAALAVIAATGGAIAATGAGALAGKYIGEAITQPKGPVITGSAAREAMGIARSVHGLGKEDITAVLVAAAKNAGVDTPRL